MKSKNLIIVKGFDLFFDDVTQSDLEKICWELGDYSSFSIERQRVTYMLSQWVLMESNKLSECHDVANITGRIFSKKTGCKFLYSELYLSMTKNQTKDFNHKQIEIITN